VHVHLIFALKVSEHLHNMVLCVLQGYERGGGIREGSGNGRDKGKERRGVRREREEIQRERR
jgi:hypothetical protein